MNILKSIILSAVCCIGLNSFGMDQFSVEEELSKDLKTSRGTKAKVADLKDKAVLLYFTASWCPPCQKFTPKVVQFLKENKDSVEVVVVSRDRSKKAATGYLKSKKANDFYMVLPGKKSDELSKDFGVKGIPMVVVLNKDGKVVTSNGRSAITKSTDLPSDWVK